MADQNWHLISYDICDPKRLRKVHACIRGYGSPIQYSVFLCRLSMKQLEELRWKLGQIKTSEDSLLIIKLCQRCAHTIVEEGPQAHFDPVPPPFQIL